MLHTKIRVCQCSVFVYAVTLLCSLNTLTVTLRNTQGADPQVKLVSNLHLHVNIIAQEYMIIITVILFKTYFYSTVVGCGWWLGHRAGLKKRVQGVESGRLVCHSRRAPSNHAFPISVAAGAGERGAAVGGEHRSQGSMCWKVPQVIN